MIEQASEEPTSTTLNAKGAPADIETFDGTIDFNAVARDQARADGIEVHEEIELKPQDLVVEGLAHTQFESVFAAPSEPTDAQDEPSIDLPLIMPDDVSEEVLPPEPPAPPVVAEEAPPFAGAQRAPAAPPTPPPAAVVLSDDDGAADVAALSRAEPVLTETMAELYLRQGHQEDALRVYQALLAQRPGDARLRGRIDALTRGGRRDRGRGTPGGGGDAGETVQAFLKRILAGRPGVSPAPEAAVGSPLERAFGATHSERVSDPGIIAPGEATRPAADGISLDEVFGDEGPRGSQEASTPAPPLPPPSSPGAQQSGGFSFDQFFSTAAAGAGGGPGTPSEGSSGVTLPPPRTSGGAPRPLAEDEGDLDQFQAWLRGLKS